MNMKALMANKKYRPSILAAVICLVIVVVIQFIPINSEKSAKIDVTENSYVKTICELATLRCFYHNVVLYEKEPDGINKIANDILLWPFGGYTQIGYKQFWMEYSGIVEMGIDASLVQISKPNADGVVEVYIPDATVLSVSADIATLSDPISESGWFTSISGEEKAEAFAGAQKEMRRQAEEDRALLRRAKENAKRIIENYIVKTGEEMGVVYTVSWIQ